MDSCTRFGTFYTAQQLLPSTGELSIECHDIAPKASHKRFVMQVVSRENCTMRCEIDETKCGNHLEADGCTKMDFCAWDKDMGYCDLKAALRGINDAYGATTQNACQKTTGEFQCKKLAYCEYMVNGGYGGAPCHAGGMGYGSDGYGGGGMGYGGDGFGGGGMGYGGDGYGGDDLMLGTWDGMEPQDVAAAAAQHGTQALADNVNRRLDAAAQLLDVVYLRRELDGGPVGSEPTASRTYYVVAGDAAHCDAHVEQANAAITEFCEGNRQDSKATGCG